MQIISNNFKKSLIIIKIKDIFILFLGIIFENNYILIISLS